MANTRVACPGIVFLVVEVNEQAYIIQHSCEMHHWTLEIPSPVILGSKPKVGEEVGVNVHLTLASKERRRRAVWIRP